MAVFYRLEKHKKPVQVTDVKEWGKSFESSDRIVKKSKFIDIKTGLVGELSTVFLGLDHRYSGKGKPLLWETMIFCNGSKFDNYLWRTTSHKQALRVHNNVLSSFRNGHVNKLSGG